MTERWGALCRRRNQLDGYREHIAFRNCMPVLFHTRAEARQWIKDNYGYMRDRPDLRAEPHGVLATVPCKVRISLSGD
jgi:hypothetical protein